jgi:hypothetical protein
MLRRLAPIVLVSVLAVAPWAGTRVTRAAALPPLVNLTPGADLRIQQTVDVNVVLIGFSGLVDPATLLAQSPLAAWNGVPQANGSGQTFIRQRFDFRYHLTMAPPGFENGLFSFLRAVAVPQAPIPIIPGFPDMPISPFQAIYNYCNVHPAFDPALGCSFDPSAPRVNARTITQNYLLSASFVEKVLSQNLILLGVDVAKPTVVLLNWWGRPDYVDHVYLEVDEPDPETGVPRGFFLENELAGYGATSHDDPETCQFGDCIPHRLWFYDISAGPMGRTGGIDLVAAVNRFVVGGYAGGVNYRFHHTADYGTTSGTYRPLNTLTFDLSRLIGAVFVSQIAYAGPLYPPGLTPPLQPHDLVLDINRWSWNGESFAGLLDVQYMLSKLNRLPYNFRAEVTEQPDGVDSRLGEVWRCSLTSGRAEQLGQSCYGNRYGGFALGDLQAYFTDHLFEFITGAPDYELPIFQFNASPPLTSPLFAGLAASNYMLAKTTPTVLPNTRQTFVFTSTSPERNAFFGHGHLLQHEVGHHLGFSHPFHGYRCLTETCGPGEFVPFGGNPSTFFSFAGQYSSGVMSYVEVNNDFSRFELDNLQRWLSWQYLDLSNFIVGEIARSPKAGSVASAVLQADAQAGLALDAYRHYDYAGAEQRSRAAYAGLVAAAAAIQVKLAPEAYQAVRRNPADFNQALRDDVESTIPDNPSAMSGAIRTEGIRGLEGLALPPPTTPLARELPHPGSPKLP